MESSNQDNSVENFSAFSILDVDEVTTSDVLYFVINRSKRKHSQNLLSAGLIKSPIIKGSSVANNQICEAKTSSIYTCTRLLTTNRNLPDNGSLPQTPFFRCFASNSFGGLSFTSENP